MELVSSSRLLRGLLELFVPRQIQTKMKEAQQDLQLSILVTQLALDALTCMDRGELRAFDALVGETSCQVRAVKVARLYNTLVRDPQARERLVQSIARIQALLDCLRILQQKEPVPQSVQQSLVAMGPKSDLSDDECFLVLA